MSGISAALRRVMMLVALALCGALALAACGSSNSSSSGSSNSSASESASGASTSSGAENTWPRTITGDNGEEITLESAPEKIVSTSVTLTGSLLAIGAPVVATGAASAESRVADDQGFFTQWSDVANERGVKALYQGEANAEAILAEEPDLIIVAANGNDSAMDLYDQLKEIAPTLVVDYSDKDWQQISSNLGYATGHDSESETLVDEYTERVSQVRDSISLPAQPVTGLVYTPARGEDASKANVWTGDSAQGSLLEDLGFRLAEVPEDVQGGTAQGSTRSDIVQVSAENLSAAITGETVFLFSADDSAVEKYKADELLGNTAAVQNDSVYALGTDTFRMDPYSANNALDRIQELFGR